MAKAKANDRLSQDPPLSNNGGSVSKFVHKLYEERARRIIIGFTGRTGSGCSTAAKMLTETKPYLRVSLEHAPSDVQDRKDRIIARFATENWHKFSSLSVTALIASYLLDDTGAEFLSFLANVKLLGVDVGQLQQPVAQRIANEIDAFRKSSSGEISRTQTGVMPPQGKTEAHADYFLTVLPNFLSKLRVELGNTYVRLFQLLGDNCRRYGAAYSGTEAELNVFSIAKRIKYAVDVVDSHSTTKSMPCCLAIDAIRNPYEADWLKQHIAGFFLIAVNTPDRDRRDRLQRLGFTSAQIDEFDTKEYPSELKSPPVGFAKIISQNIQSCLEKVDIHLNNPGFAERGDNEDTSILATSLTRYVCLMQHPGLVTPTREERCMQVAFAAKINSGCISRQVGAAVTDEEGAIMSVGWNDVPRGQVPCLLRDRADLIGGKDQDAFSTYERKDADFTSHFRKLYLFENKPALKGRSMQFCFREAYNKKTGEKNQVHTRSLHAEENAFLQLAKFGVRLPRNSVLYTSASPCELCSKKAFQLGIGKIYYIDPYPGISASHTLGVGIGAPVMHLYSGAIGTAYHRLYEPLMPLKDELNYIMSESNPDPVSASLQLE